MVTQWHFRKSAKSRAAFGQALLQLSHVSSLGRRMKVRGPRAGAGSETQQQLGALEKRDMRIPCLVSHLVELSWSFWIKIKETSCKVWSPCQQLLCWPRCFPNFEPCCKHFKTIRKVMLLSVSASITLMFWGPDQPWFRCEEKNCQAKQCGTSVEQEWSSDEKLCIQISGTQLNGFSICFVANLSVSPRSISLCQVALASHPQGEVSCWCHNS